MDLLYTAWFTHEQVAWIQVKNQSTRKTTDRPGACRINDKSVSCAPANKHLRATISRARPHPLRAVRLVSWVVCRASQVYQVTTIHFHRRTGATTLSMFYGDDPASHDRMELSTNNCRTRRTTGASLPCALSHTEYTLHQATPDISAKSVSHRTALTEPAVTAEKQAAPSFIERVLPRHIDTCTAGNMAVTVVESDLKNIEHQSQPLLKAVHKLSPDTKREIQHKLETIGVLTKGNCEATF